MNVLQYRHLLSLAPSTPFAGLSGRANALSRSRLLSVLSTTPWRAPMADPQIPRRPPLPDEPTVEQQLLRSTGSIVGIGASAGGLEAFTTFFRHMPPDSGLAFVLVQHLDPHQPSLLPDLLASQTLMPVHTIIDQMAVKPDQIYVIPPNTTLTIEQGVLGLALPIEARGHRMPIDHFFQSLAADQGAHAIGIVFSGADTDGTLGLAAIQDAGGLTLAQEPESARFATMPRSAIDRQVVDQVLPIVEMPAYLSAYAAESATNGRFTSTAAPQMETGAGLQAICTILRSTTGHDFSQYKPATLLRRIERRMQVTRATNLTTYAEQLRHDRSEANLLFQDLLISVTSFFRDPVAFDSLANAVVPALFHGKSTDSPLRVWVAGCATGEEAYTIAILLLEHMDRTGTRIPVQLFASDIDEAALVVARQGRYDAAIAAHISAERLTQFFSQEGGAYQVSKALRELCIFSAHNLISDPPAAACATAALCAQARRLPVAWVC
jgi:two-component system CheB/CheR fusion protein